MWWRKDLKGEDAISEEHIDNNKAERKILHERGVRPESLPPSEDVSKVKRRLESEGKKVLKETKKVTTTIVKKTKKEINPTETMIHVVFQANDAEVLKKSFELDSSMQGDVIRIADDFAVGPLKDIYSPAGIGARKQWWRKVHLAGGDYEGLVDNASTVDDNKTVADLVERLGAEPKEDCWIWAAQNKATRCKRLLLAHEPVKGVPGADLHPLS